MSDYWSNQRDIWFNSPAGTIYRFLLSLWCFALTVEVPLLAIGFLGYAAFLMLRGIFFRHMFKWLAYAGIPTPNQFRKAYLKLWHGSVKHGPVTKVIKAHPSGPTP